LIFFQICVAFVYIRVWFFDLDLIFCLPRF
jgi:hypothetical protein